MRLFSVSLRVLCRQCPCWVARCCKSRAIQLLVLVPPRQFQRCIGSTIHRERCDSSAQYRRSAEVCLVGYVSAGPLHLLIDSTGIKAEGEGEWNARKHGGSKRRLWRKIHIVIDDKTLEIRAIEATSSSIGDAPVLPDLLNQIPSDEEIGSATADGAYDTRKCHDAIAARNARAVILQRKNAKLWKPDTPSARAQNEAV
jgi:hypothetical protein